jgi:hypothetical protein
MTATGRNSGNAGEGMLTMGTVLHPVTCSCNVPLVLIRGAPWPTGWGAPACGDRQGPWRNPVRPGTRQFRAAGGELHEDPGR